MRTSLPLAIVRTIIDLGASDTPNDIFTYAIEGGPNTEVLLHFAFDPTAQAYLRCTSPTEQALAAVHAAVIAGDLAALKLLVLRAEELRVTAWKHDEDILRLAILVGKVPIVQFLLAHDVAARYLSFEGFPFRDDTANVLEYFLDLGIPLPDDITSKPFGERRRWTSPLHHASHIGATAVLSCLTRRGMHLRRSRLGETRSMRSTSSTILIACRCCWMRA